MKARLLTLALFAALTAGALSARAVEPSEMLADPVLEARARDISEGLRCLVCQNESIDSSNAELAHDLRVLVRERLVAGDTDDQVRQYIVARYGDFVLLKPPMKPATYALWFGPAVILILGAGAVFLYFRRRAADTAGGPGAAAGPALSPEEQARLDRLLGSE
jgi:cytochrome c-type biogenesis protein CcmH